MASVTGGVTPPSVTVGCYTLGTAKTVPAPDSRRKTAGEMHDSAGRNKHRRALQSASSGTPLSVGRVETASDDPCSAQVAAPAIMCCALLRCRYPIGGARRGRGRAIFESFGRLHPTASDVTAVQVAQKNNRDVDFETEEPSYGFAAIPGPRRRFLILAFLQGDLL